MSGAVPFSIFCWRDAPVDLSLLLGPRVGLRSRRRLAAAMRAPFVFAMPPKGAVRVTFTPSNEQPWTVEVLP
jgi:hypothetical protein